MPHQSYWPGEATCFGHEADKFVTSGSRRRRLHYRWDIICMGAMLAVIAAAGEILFVLANGMLSRLGFVVAVVAAVWIVGYFANPIHTSVSAFYRRRKMQAVK